MKNEREKSNGKVDAGTLRLTGGRVELAANEEKCRVLLVSGGSCTLDCGGTVSTVNPGCVALLPPGETCVIQQAGHAAPELSGCGFPLVLLHDLHTLLQKDFARMFAERQLIVLHGPVQWSSRIRTLLELMRGAAAEPDFPGVTYLALVLHYVEQEYAAESRAAARPHNETVEQICAYLAANYQQKLTLSQVAAQFYLSPYYLSRLFRRVTGQSIVDYINGQRIEAAQRLLEDTELSISAVAEQTGFSTAAHFRRVFRELMGVGPLQYRKGHQNPQP